MAKYSFDFKLSVVKEYKAGSVSYRSLANKYEIPNKEQVRRWVNSYNAFGEDGLRKSRSQKVYSVQFKLNVLNFMKRTGASHQDTAIKFGMNNPSLIANWNRTFLNEGIEGLKKKPKGRRPPMSRKRKTEPVKQEKTMSREKQLERENELLRLEIAYLKKLKAFQKSPDAFLEKHKQQWHSNSKEKDSN